MSNVAAKGVHSVELSAQPVVTLKDGQGNILATDSSTIVTLRIKPGTGTPGATLTCSGSLSKTVSGGVATFSGCKIDLKGDGYILGATAGDATLATTDPIDTGWGGDANGDCLVDIVDFSVLLRSFDMSPGDATYDARADLNRDNIVDIGDFSVMAMLFGTRCPSLVLSPTSGAAGTEVTVIGSGFVANREVSVTFDGEAVTSVEASTITDGNGDFAASFSVPTDAASGPHAVKASLGHSAVWDAAAGRMLVFGGSAGTSVFNELWSCKVLAANP